MVSQKPNSEDKCKPVNMSLYDTVRLREDLPLSFENDGFELTPSMIYKYKKSKIPIINGQTKSRLEYFCKNASIFDLTGTKIAWGDISPRDVKQMFGVYYILSEHKSFWKPDEYAVKGWDFKSEDPNSRSAHRELLPVFEPVVVDIRYVKANAIARIVDGEIQTSRDLILGHYQ